MNVLLSILRGLLSIFKQGKDTWSSKRFCGVVGCMVFFGCYINACATHTEMPAISEFLFGGCITLLGIERVTSIFKKE